MSEKQITHLNKQVRAALPALLGDWLGEARAELETLTRAACDESLTDAEFIAALKEFRKDPLRLVKLMNTEALAGLLEKASGTALAIGRADVLERAQSYRKRVKKNER